MERHPNLTQRRAQTIEVHRIKASTLENIGKYFAFINETTKTVENLNGGPLSPNQLANMDEVVRALEVNQ